MRIAKAVGALCELLEQDELVVSANGSISRELHAVRHCDENFYMLGSMGQASSIALGLAMSQPDRRIIALDGDGNLIMNLGILATVCEFKPPNFLHVVLDNGVYGTTGGQPTAARVVDLAKMARAAGYRNVAVASTTSQVKRVARKMLDAKGPSMLLLKIRPVTSTGLARITLTPGQICRRFRKSATAGGVIKSKKHRSLTRK